MSSTRQKDPALCEDTITDFIMCNSDCHPEHSLLFFVKILDCIVQSQSRNMVNIAYLFLNFLNSLIIFSVEWEEFVWLHYACTFIHRNCQDQVWFTPVRITFLKLCEFTRNKFCTIYYVRMFGIMTCKYPTIN